jgi:hypothetical protein
MLIKYFRTRKKGEFTPDGLAHFMTLRYTVIIMTINLILTLLALAISIIK